MKALLIGLLLASPPVAAWMLRATGADAAAAGNPVGFHTCNRHPARPIQIPVEIVTKGSAPRWVYVEVSHQAIPEPGVVSLMALASLLLLRRQRSDGK